MMKHFKYLILLFLFPAVLSAQSLRQQIAKKEVNTEKKQQKNPNSVIKANKPRSESDTIYCLSTQKQHGWFLPQDIVSLNNAKKHGRYIMFTRKNAQGHWTKLETFDSYGDRTSIGFRPYILSENDPQGDQKWIEKVNTGCISEIIADPLGENVVQERVYDKDNNLVFSFSRTPIGENKYIGTYKDVYGLPAEMRKDSTFTYGTLVVITEDKWGNDSTIEYVDAKGVPKENSNGVGMSFYIYDKNGRVIRQGSANHNGELVIDNWGNCGVESEFDVKTGLATAAKYLNENWVPIPLANQRTEAGWHAGTTKHLYRYDKYRRLLEQKFVTIENKPDTNIYGTHRIVYTYDDYGNTTSLTGYGIDGKLAPYNQYGEAKALYRYDGMGRAVYGEFFDKENMPLSYPGRWCSFKRDYGDDGSTKEINWTWKDGHLDTLYYKHRTKDWIYTKFTDNIIEIDSLDKNGYIRDEAYYDYSMTPISFKLGYDNIPYQRKRIRELHKGKYLEYITEKWNAKGEYAGQTPYRVSLRDTTNKRSLETFYDSELRLTDTYIQNYSSNGQLNSQSDTNAYGIICRAGGTGRTRYYSAEVLYSQKGEYASFIAKDEFGEPDYILSSPNVVYYYQKLSNKGKRKFYDVENHEITDFDKFRNECPKAMSIEVTDSSAYKFGLMDNDIILRYGESYQIADSLSYWDFVGSWSVAQCMEAQREKQMLVFRINPKTKDYGVVSLTLPKGNPSQLGFIAHLTFKTPKQRTRIKESISKYCKQCIEDGTICWWNQNVEPEIKNMNIVVAFPDMFRADRYQPYPLQIIDPSIILAYNVPSIGKYWSFGQDANSLKSITTFRNDCQIVHPFNMYYLKNGSHFENCIFTEKTAGFTFFNYKVTKSQYNYFEKQFKLAEKQISKDMHSVQEYHRNQLFGKWQIEIPDKKAIVNLNLHDYILKYESIVSNNENLQDGTTYSVKYKLSAKYGKWYVKGHTIMFNLSDMYNDLTLSEIDIDGLEGEEKETKMNELQAIFEQNKSELISQMDLSKLLGTSELIIQEVGSNELKVTDGTNHILFKKIE